MGISIDKFSKQQLIYFSMVLMLVSLFTSRFLLSVGFVLFIFLTCFHKNILNQLICFIRNPFLMGMSFLFLVPFVTWFWTEDKNMWMRFARIKLPLFLFPIAFAGTWQLSSKQWKWMATIFIFLVIAGCSWSLWQYFQNIHTIHEQYLQAKLMPTPLENDHVRYSLIVTIAIMCLALLIQKDMQLRKRSLSWMCLAFLTIYLHILSARTGLISLYIFLLFAVFYTVFKRKKVKLFLILAILLFTMPAASWFLFPTFQNRIRYNVYDLSNIRENKYVAGANDGNRILSLKAGWNVLQENPFGAGADVVEKTYQWYDKHVPQMSETEKLFPSSEPLMYAGFAGWIGLVAFFITMLSPFFERVKKNYGFWLVLNLIMAFSFLFDIGLEAQFGVFIYAFVVLWWWKWFNTSSANKAGL